jgi:hypothetical protein
MGQFSNRATLSNVAQDLVCNRTEDPNENNEPVSETGQQRDGAVPKSGPTAAIRVL